MAEDVADLSTFLDNLSRQHISGQNNDHSGSSFPVLGLGLELQPTPLGTNA
jgi:hypothetical protein